jgi:hypothetical protein
LILDIQTKKSIKLCQELTDACMAYMRFHNNPDLDSSLAKKTTTKKRLLRAIENMHEFLEGAGKILKIKPPNKTTVYRTPNTVVHIINKD